MKKLFVAIAFAVVAGAGATEMLIKSAAISEKGEWTIGINKSAVGGKIIYSKKKGPENTASGTYNMPEAGKYYIWVQTLTYGEKWRKTDVKFNGKSVGKFGDEGAKRPNPAWTWKRSLAAFDFAEGEFKLELVPMSDASRVGTIILTTDKDYTPVDKDVDTLEDIAELECE